MFEPPPMSFEERSYSDVTKSDTTHIHIGGESQIFAIKKIVTDNKNYTINYHIISIIQLTFI